MVPPSYRSEHEIQRGKVTCPGHTAWSPQGKLTIPEPSPPGPFPYSILDFSIWWTQTAATPTLSRLEHHQVLKSSPGFPRETYFGFSFFSSAHLKKSESPF